MKNKSVYIFELILFAFIIALKFIFIDRLTDYLKIALIAFWLVNLFVLYNFWGLRKYKSLVASNSKQITIIIIMLYFLLTYLSGIYLGFLRNSYSTSLVNVFNNTFYLIIMIVSEELIRAMVANKCTYKKQPLVILTILYILLDIALIFNVSSVNSNFKLFVFICNSCLPIIARNVLCSYLVKRIGYIPGIVFRLVITIYIYVLPIFPDIGYYISSVLGILIPFIIYFSVSKIINDSERKKISPIRKNLWYIDVPLTIILIFVVALVSGVFRYQIMAIASGSMQPVIYRGDAVIFEKFNDEEKDLINIGDVVVFRHNGKYITHRVINKYVSDEDIFVYQTKGDNNVDMDNFQVATDEVVGVVKMKINYIGFPSLWIQELFIK